MILKADKYGGENNNKNSKTELYHTERVFLSKYPVWIVNMKKQILFTSLGEGRGWEGEARLPCIIYAEELRIKVLGRNKTSLLSRKDTWFKN